MRWIVETSLKLPMLVAVFAVGLIVLGTARLNSVPIGVLPEFDPPTVRVQTEALGLSAAEVEQFITAPLEQDLLNGVAFLRTIKSSSVAGLSVVDMEFEPGTDIFVARQVVQERLTQAHALPNVSTPPQMIQPVSSTGRIMMIGMTSDEVSLIDMSLVARWTLKARLIGVPGVSNVSIWGMRDRQLQIRLDPKDLFAENVSLRKLVATAANALWTSPLGFVEASTPGTGGWIENANQRLPIQHELPINNAADLARVVIFGPDPAGEVTAVRQAQERRSTAASLQTESVAPLTIGDVAEVVEDHQPLIGDAAFNGSPGLMIVVEKSPWANVRDVTRALDEALDELRPGLSGINLDANVYRSADYLQASMDNLSKSVLLGSVLALASLVVLIWDWRVTLASVIAIPLALLGAANVLFALGQNVNVILLAGLAAGLVIVVENAISIGRDIAVRIESAHGSPSILSQIIESSTRVNSPTPFILALLFLTLLPATVLSGSVGALFSPIVWAIGMSALAAFVIALTVTPVVSWFLFSRFPGALRPSPALAAMTGAYRSILGRAVQLRTGILVVTLAMAVATLALIPMLRHTELVPRIHEPSLLIGIQAAPGTSMPEMLRLTDDLTAELRNLPGVDKVGAHVGRSLVGDHIVSVNSGQIWATLSPDAEYKATLVAISDAVDRIPGLSADLSAYANTGVADALKTPVSDLTVRLYGPNAEVLLDQAQGLRETMAAVDGIVDTTIVEQKVVPVLEIKVDLDKAALAGITPGDVRRTASILLSGLIVGQFFEAQKVFDVVVWGKPDIRKDVDSVRSLLIDTPSGVQVQLGDVAEVSIINRPEEIKREASSRYVDILAYTDGHAIEDVENVVREALLAIPQPYEYHAVVRGTTASIRDRNLHTFNIVVASAIGILLVIQAALTSWRRSLLLVAVILASLLGSMLGALLIGNVSLGVYAGFLAIFGLAASQGLQSLLAVQSEEDRPGATFDVDLISRMAIDRFSPVLTAGLSVILFYVPFIFSPNAPGLVTLAPFALVVVLGALTTMFTNLVLVPGLCSVVGKGEKAETFEASQSPTALAGER